jgi:hypothetical protein
MITHYSYSPLTHISAAPAVKVALVVDVQMTIPMEAMNPLEYTQLKGEFAAAGMATKLGTAPRAGMPAES